MRCGCHSVGLSLLALSALVSESAFCQTKAAEPLKLRFNSASSITPHLSPVRADGIGSTSLGSTSASTSGGRRGPRFQQAPASLSQRALESLLENAEQDPAPASAPNQAMFRFERRGSAGRDLSQGYKAMCQNASEKLWDEPNGKRVKFDIAGKPGVAIEIPIR